MAIIPSLADLGKITDPNTFIRMCSQAIQQIIGQVNGKLTFDDNIASQTVNISFTSANTNVAVPHKLNKTGVGFITIFIDGQGNIYRDNTQPDTTSVVYLKCTNGPRSVVAILL